MNTEPLDHVLKKQDSFPHMWALLAPKDEFRDLYPICLKRWERLTYRQQQQLYWFIREKQRHKETVYENPLYAITYTHPFPHNRNGESGIDEMMKTNKMVSAFFHGKFGIYTLCEATIFEMTHVKPLN